MEVIAQDRRDARGHEEEMYLLPEELNKRGHEAGVALIRSKERVLNDELRHELMTLQKLVTEVELLSLTLRDADATRHETA